MESMQEDSVESNKIHEIRLIVAGTRTFDDYVLMREKLDRIILGLQEDYSGAPVVIISGNAKGADQLGIRYAMERNLSFRRFPAQWHQYGKAAGPMRNAPDVSLREGRHSGAGCILGWKKPRNR